VVTAADREVVHASTVGVLAAGSGTRRTALISVIRLTGTASTVVSRAPARPPSARPTEVSSRAACTVRLPYRPANRGNGSLKIFLLQTGLAQKNRRTRTSISTSRPLIARSDSRRQ
jgi:hypothetical protein